MRFGDDWTGIFIRGDNAFGHAIGLQQILFCLETGRPLATYHALMLKSLRELLMKSNEHAEGFDKDSIQRLREFDNCLCPAPVS